MDERIYKSVMEFWIDLSVFIFVVLFFLNYYLLINTDRFMFVAAFGTPIIMFFMILLSIKTLSKTLIGKILVLTVFLSILPTFCFFTIDQSRDFLTDNVLKYSNLMGGILVFILGVSRKIIKHT